MVIHFPCPRSPNPRKSDELIGDLISPAPPSTYEIVPEQSYPLSAKERCPPPYLYGLDRSWLAAQMARFTATGAAFGAAAIPARRRAEFPDTVGPEPGNGNAIADEAAKQIVPPKRLRKILRYTVRF